MFFSGVDADFLTGYTYVWDDGFEAKIAPTIAIIVAELLLFLLDNFHVSTGRFARAIRMLFTRMHRMASCSLAAILTLSLLAAGCGGSHSLPKSEGIGLTTDNPKVARDETRSYKVQVHATPGEKPGVTSLSVANLPSGVTARFEPTTLDLSNNLSQTATLYLTADRAMTAGKYQVSLRRTNGSGFSTDEFTLNIADFAVSIDVDSTDVTLNPGGSQDIDVAINRRGNSSGTAELRLGGTLPDGISASFDPPRVLIDLDHPRVHSTLTLSADSSATANSSDKIHVKALKGTNTDNSDDIDVALQVPDTSDAVSARKAAKTKGS